MNSETVKAASLPIDVLEKLSQPLVDWWLDHYEPVEWRVPRCDGEWAIDPIDDLAGELTGFPGWLDVPEEVFEWAVKRIEDLDEGWVESWGDDPECRSIDT
jgi:hypothetical protein